MSGQDLEKAKDDATGRKDQKVTEEFVEVLVRCLTEGSVQTAEDVIELLYAFQQVRSIGYGAEFTLDDAKRHVNHRMSLSHSLTETPRGQAILRSPELIAEAQTKSAETNSQQNVAQPEYEARVIDYLVESHLFDTQGVANLTRISQRRTTQD